MGRHRVVTAGIVLYEDAVLVAAVHVAGDEVKLLPLPSAQDSEVAHAGYVALAADGVHDPEAAHLG